MLTHPQAKEIYSDLEDYLLWYHEKEVGGIHLISGMAEGWDEAIAKVGMRNNIPYDVYIPTRNYGSTTGETTVSRMSTVWLCSTRWLSLPVKLTT